MKARGREGERARRREGEGKGKRKIVIFLPSRGVGGSVLGVFGWHAVYLTGRCSIRHRKREGGLRLQHETDLSAGIMRGFWGATLAIPSGGGTGGL